MSSILDGVVAPFSESHPYNFLNPWIDPWWEELTKTEQKDIYAHWEKIQPLALALAKTVESKLRTKDAFKKLLHSKAEYLKEAVHLAFKAVKGDRGMNKA